MGEICKVTKLAGFEFTKYVNYSNTGSILAIRGINVKKGKFNLQDVKYIDNSNFSRLSRSKLQEGDILFTYVGTIGNSAIVPKNVNWYLAPNVCLIRPQDKNSSFISYLIQSDRFQHEEILKWITTSSQPALSMENIRKFKIILPLNSEQQKISSLVSKIDKLITLQQRKLNDLNSMKSALLQDVFPNTQGIKKIKLSTQEWNLQKISSIFKERNQRNKNGMLLSVSISKGVYPFSENDRKDNSSNDKSNYKEVKINDLAYNSMRMWQGAVGVSKYNGIVSPAYTVITPKKEENPNFYYYYFKNKRMLFNFRQHSQGLTSDTWNLKFPLFEKILIQVPSDKEEEQRISSLFKQIDKSIELSKIQIKKLTSIKQFLLQNMFI